MAEKDLSEKILESHNDVFADIINGFFYKGEQVISPDELTDHFSISSFSDKGKLRSQERDVSKLWIKGKFTIACIGVENQSKVEANMPLRIMAYDGGEYKRQANNRFAHPYPVITLVLYFGKRPWRRPRSLFERLTIDPKLKPFVNDYKINIFDVSHMSQKQVINFSSDFKIIADYFAQLNATGEYIPSTIPIKHPVDTGEMLKYVTGDNRFESLLCSKKGGINNMYDAFAAAEKRGETRGEAKGEARGIELAKKLIALGRISDLERAADNEAFRNQLLKEFALQ